MNEDTEKIWGSALIVLAVVLVVSFKEMQDVGAM